MKLKMDEAGHVVVSEGKPVYVHDDGKEVAFDAPLAVAKITQLNAEAKTHRTAKEAAEEKLKAFDGIDDPAAAKKALGVVANLDAKKLVDAGQVETVKQEAIAAVEAKYKPVVEERDRLKGDLYAERIGGNFSRSKFIGEKLAIPSDIAQARFEKHFEVKDGKTIAKDMSGNPIYSRAKPGELADFEEAIETLVEQYPQKDHILKAIGNKGDGARPTNAGGGNNADLSKLSPVERMNAARARQAAR